MNAIKKKTIYTGYYGMARYIPEQHQQIAVSRTMPDWWQEGKKSRIQCLEVAPKREEMHAPNWKYLYSIHIDIVQNVGRLAKLVKAMPDSCVLMCYETDPQDCHRKILLDYIIEHYDVEGCEFSQRPVAGQPLSLF